MNSFRVVFVIPPLLINYMNAYSLPDPVYLGCLSNPCQNNGTCSEGDIDFHCTCASGWSGKYCTETKSHCHDGACLNGGTCVSKSGDSTTCDCIPGWSGQFCENIVNECEGEPCFNGATCETGPGWYRCICATGFTGYDCRNQTNDCNPMPCLGGGTCIDGIGEFMCICPPGRAGNRCEILLSHPRSMCIDPTTVSPFTLVPVSKDLSDMEQEGKCNFCLCNKQPICSKLWCGLPNCFVTNEKNNNTCTSNEVCVPNLEQSCLSGSCPPRGDCRKIESSQEVAAPKYPVPRSCWPNQAVNSPTCRRITLRLGLSQTPRNWSVENICINLRFSLAARIVLSGNNSDTPLIVLLCDIINGSNNMIELTVSTISDGPDGIEAVSMAVNLINEILSRNKTYYKQTKNVEAALLSAIFDIKVDVVPADYRCPKLFIILPPPIIILALLIIIFKIRKSRTEEEIKFKNIPINDKSSHFPILEKEKEHVLLWDQICKIFNKIRQL